MGTFLITWNPKLWPWDDLPIQAKRVARRGYASDSWKFNAHRMVRVNDRVFLLRVGPRDPGLMASGWVVSEPRQYKTKLKQKGRKYAWCVDVDFDTLLAHGTAVFPRKQLERGIFRRMNWSTRKSGTPIPESVASALESAWSDFLGKPRPIAPKVLSDLSDYEGGRIEMTAYRRGRSRKLRDEAIQASSGICEVCQRDYSRLLNGKGLRVLQVHHKRQLGFRDEPTLTRIGDLAVVCANCHLLVHLNPRRAMAISTLRARLGFAP